MENTSSAQTAKRRYRPLGGNSTVTAGDFRKKPDCLFSTDDVAAAGIVRSRTALRRAVRDGKLPRPIRLPSGYLAWKGQTVADWLDGLERQACAA